MRTKPTKSDICYVQNNPENLTPESLSEELDLKLSVVNSLLAEKKKSEPKPQTQFEKTIIKNGKGVTIMSQGASEVIDATRSKGKDTSSYICKAKAE